MAAPTILKCDRLSTTPVADTDAANHLCYTAPGPIPDGTLVAIRIRVHISDQGVNNGWADFYGSARVGSGVLAFDVAATKQAAADAAVTSITCAFAAVAGPTFTISAGNTKGFAGGWIWITGEVEYMSP
jgi:hypothetical protein